MLFFSIFKQIGCALLKGTLILVAEKQRGEVLFTFAGGSCWAANQHNVLSKPRRLPSGPVARLRDF